MPLVVETIGTNKISVAHYYEMNGDLVADPEIVYYVVHSTLLGKPQEDWYPMEITQFNGYGYRRCMEYDKDGKLVLLDYQTQFQLARFSFEWASNLKEQGWLEHGVKPSVVSKEE
jgi:hypothetical protein